MAKVKVEVLKGQVDYSSVGDTLEVDSVYVERLVKDGFVKVVETPAKPASKTKEKTK
ncbi:hypothetical protein [Listeria seeligeri]|uniref:hypothetical protein n=1 Tax=Listeria seeligeri TaxID=1640 RepID=UPI0016288417|nr:hypothetical protein [Listeria seeligeri]HAM2077740.1 hypothetical protein [Listeria monocytogenes]MBC1744504.1 hypothetical protein [Listeria seeligeri]HBZ6456255.1 hypothetical protein [Listeria monocytogenes]HBZ6462277.1 hypothetical protein [Listeria monocytogenes]HEM0755713.1 hypothetical protein [Listeria monocytogenes]